MAAALSRVYAGLCRRDRLTSKECPFWLDSLFCDVGVHRNQFLKFWPELVSTGTGFDRNWNKVLTGTDLLITVHVSHI